MTPIAHPDHLLVVAHQRHQELVDVARHHRWWRQWQRSSRPVPAVVPEREVALAA